MPEEGKKVTPDYIQWDKFSS